MRHRIWIAAAAAVAVGATGAVTAQAGPPLEGSFSGALKVKGSYKKDDESSEERKFKFVDTDNSCLTNPDDFSIFYGGPSVHGDFDGRHIVQSGSADQQALIRGLLAHDGTTRGLNLVSATTKGKANFRKDGSKVLMTWTIEYEGDDASTGGGQPVKGKIKLSYVGSALS